MMTRASESGTKERRSIVREEQLAEILKFRGNIILTKDGVCHKQKPYRVKI